jgi:hypothetical protein
VRQRSTSQGYGSSDYEDRLAETYAAVADAEFLNHAQATGAMSSEEAAEIAAGNPMLEAQQQNSTQVDVRDDKTINKTLNEIISKGKPLDKGERPILSGVRVVAGDTYKLRKGDTLIDGYGGSQTAEELVRTMTTDLARLKRKISNLCFEALSNPCIPIRRASARVDLPLPRGPIMQVNPEGNCKLTSSGRVKSFV